MPEIVEASADGANSIPDTPNARLIFVLWVGNGHNGTRDEGKIGEREDYMKKQSTFGQPSEAEGPCGEVVASRSALLLAGQEHEEGVTR